MTRFHIVAISAAAAGVAALAWQNMALLAAVGSLFILVITLGVAIPRLQLFGPFVCYGSNARRCVALTFDDGPDARSTPELLNLLKEENVRVVFFGVGERVTTHPELAKRIVRDGHLLENHSYTHSHATNIFSVARLRSDLERTQTAIQQATGTVPRWFRPPMGLSNPRVFHAAHSLGLTVVGWSARGLDTQLTEPKRIVDRILRRLAPGAIILLHDGNIPAERLVLTVKLLLASLRAHGYEVVRLDQLLK